MKAPTFSSRVLMLCFFRGVLVRFDMGFIGFTSRGLDRTWVQGYDIAVPSRRYGLVSAWVTLFFAGLLEVCWAVGLKYTQGFTRPIPTAFTLITLAGSMYLLAKAAEVLPIGTAYAVWVGIGAVGAGVLGIVLFKEPIAPLRIGFMILLVVSILGLKYTSAS